VYHEQTEPLIGYYTLKGLLRNVAGEGTIEEVFRRIVAAVSPR
jgi:adenylate kinase family enzyme